MSIATTYGFSFVKRPLFPSVGRDIAVDSSNSISVDTGLGDYPFQGSMIIDSNQRLHLIYVQGTTHNTLPNQNLIYRTSDDDGVTWTAESIIIAHGGVLIANPTISLTSTGRIIVTAFKAGLIAIWSDNGGDSWTSPVEWLSSAFIATNNIGGSCGMISLPSGRLLFPLNGNPSGLRQGWIYKSDNDGATIELLSKSPVNGALDMNEGALLRRSDGLIYFLQNENSNTGCYFSTSGDAGAVFSAFRLGVVTKNYPAMCETESKTIFVSSRASTAGAKNSWAYSKDRGLTYSALVENSASDEGPGMGTAAAWNPVSQTVVLVYWYEDFGSVSFQGPTSIRCVRFKEVN